jgi:osmoprotectant transport system substrate-binding protein
MTAAVAGAFTARPRRHRRASSDAGLSRCAVMIALFGWLLIGCTHVTIGQARRSTDGAHVKIRVASFEFPESQLVAEIYAQALERRKFPVDRVLGLGTREVVEPALEGGLIDIVPEYAGSALQFLGLPRAGTGDRTAVRARLAGAFAPHGIAVLNFAAAEDKNGIVVTTKTAQTRHLRRISDLQAIAPSLTFGGPPECPQRPYCLLGLQGRYRLRFARFSPEPSRAATAQALRLGEVDVGMLETTDPQLADRDLVELGDDRHLQPAENVVPVVRRSVLDRQGAGFMSLINSVSAKLSTKQLVQLNRRASLDPTRTPQIASSWLTSQGVK